jgi:hypothetical protein
MEPSVAICQSIEEYRKIREKTSDPAFKGVQGSLEKSLECGCEYCSLTCRLVDKGDELDRNKERNQEAFVENSGFSLSPGEKTVISKETLLKGEFNGSGLRFKGETSSTELFVTDRKNCSSNVETSTHSQSRGSRPSTSRINAHIRVYWFRPSSSDRMEVV